MTAIVLFAIIHSSMDLFSELSRKSRGWANNKYFQILLSVAISVFIFYAGFYSGSNRALTDFSPSELAGGTQEADLTPYWKAWDLLEEKFAPASTTAPQVSAQEKIWGSIAGLAASYGDPYTTFFPPVQSKMFGDEISGSFGGVGMEIDIKNGLLTVVSPLKGTPAYKAGVKAGDKIIKIGNTAASSLSVGEAVKLIRGEIGTQVSITFAREGVEDVFVKTMTREQIDIPTIETKQLESGVFVISLYNFSAVSPNLFRSALREFIESGDDKLILDLRGNPGGYLEAALDMASWFLPSGKVVVSEDFGDKRSPEVYESKGYDVFNDNLKFAILIDRGSASASEILAGALQENGKAVLVGENTFGKGSVQELIDITDDTSLKITVAHWLTPTGKSISNGGLKPDIAVELTEENTKNGADPVLNRAVEYLVNGK